LHSPQSLAKNSLHYLRKCSREEAIEGRAAVVDG
jgi:hypothetical protein